MIKIVVPFYNVENWIDKTIRSIQSQTYTNFQVLLIDDISTDKTHDVISPLIKDDFRFKLVQNQTKKYALANIVDGIALLNPDDDDIIMVVDGDDWLAHERVFERVIEVYHSTGCLMTHGSHEVFPTKKRGFVKPYSRFIRHHRLYRYSSWQLTHLRTFKYKLWPHLHIDDLKTKSGSFYSVSYDIAMMIPLAELAGEKVEYMDDILYIYNQATPLNDHKVRFFEQNLVYKYILKQPRYPSLESGSQSVSVIESFLVILGTLKNNILFFLHCIHPKYFTKGRAVLK